jgi:hypothetical protein
MNLLRLQISKETSLKLKELRYLKNKIKIRGTRTVLNNDILLPFIDEYVDKELTRIKTNLKKI